jgi:hypothetical protein
MGHHGRAALIELAAAVTCLTVAGLAAGVLGQGLVGAALAMAGAVTLSGGLIVPLYACSLLKLSPLRYLREVLPGPLAAAAPLATTLALVRILHDGSALTALAWGAGLGGLVAAVVYWNWVVPPTTRRQILGRIGRRPRPAVAAETHS